PVDRVENPSKTAGASRTAEFLAENAIGRKRGGDETAEQFFGRAVGDGDRRQVSLLLDGVIILLKVPQSLASRLFAGSESELQSRSHVGWRNPNRECGRHGAFEHLPVPANFDSLPSPLAA